MRSELAVLALLLPVVYAQEPPARLTFEVASIRVAPPGRNGVRGGCHGIDNTDLKSEEAPAPLGRCVITDARLSHLIGIAFGVSMQVLQTGPDWIQRGDLRFDVQAKAENPSKATQKDLITMLQNLLIDRFQLKYHQETIQKDGFSFTVGKNGPKFKESTAEKRGLVFRGPKGEAIGKPQGGSLITMNASKISMGDLAQLLSNLTSGPVVDATGLSGEYDLTLFWDEENGPVLTTAMRDQLGLQMKAEKIPYSTFIVDSAEKPTGN